jgi:hypothetical protein
MTARSQFGELATRESQNRPTAHGVFELVWIRPPARLRLPTDFLLFFYGKVSTEDSRVQRYGAAGLQILAASPWTPIAAGPVLGVLHGKGDNDG